MRPEYFMISDPQMYSAVLGYEIYMLTNFEIISILKKYAQWIPKKIEESFVSNRVKMYRWKSNKFCFRLSDKNAKNKISNDWYNEIDYNFYIILIYKNGKNWKMIIIFNMKTNF